MSAALTIVAKQRGDVTFVHQLLYYPVTDAGQDTASYREFADGPYLTAKGMAWFWDAYPPPHPGGRADDERPLQRHDPLRGTRATAAAVEQAIRVLHGALGTG